MNQKVLLINPNRFKSPPVPPIGIEYVASSLEERGHETAILDLCFAGEVTAEVDSAISAFRPDIAGITVRNIDSVLFHTNEFFLDDIRALITHIKKAHGLRVMVGGAGVTAFPEGIREYLGADYLVSGPGEYAVHEVLAYCGSGMQGQKVFQGRYPVSLPCRRRPYDLAYDQYSRNGGVAGFETHKGCSSSCVYCLEACSKVAFKKPEDVIREIKTFVDAGLRHFHLCDPEFNESYEYAIDFCTALKKAGMDIQWAAYMKPANFDAKLFRLMKETGVYLVTVTVDSWKKCPMYWVDVEKFLFSAKSCGMKVAVDFLTGFPYEKETEILEYLDTLRRPLPDSIGVNTYIRLYKALRITDIVMSDRQLHPYLIDTERDPTCIQPVFYNQIPTGRLKELLRGDPIFRIEGIEQSVNYSRI
ncbi:MAG: B12-binding domain-containing radical SAM protein [Nitrospirota bacterium]